MSSDGALPMTVPSSRFSIDLRDLACQRLDGVDCAELRAPDGDTPHRIWVAVPASYAAKPRRRYPLLVLLNTSELFGSAVEMSRLMAQTREIEECIVVCLETPVETADEIKRHCGFINGPLLSWCGDSYRVAPGQAALFSGLAGIADSVVSGVGTAALLPLPAMSDGRNDGGPVPNLVNGLRQRFGTGHQYGSELLPLGHPVISGALRALRPYFDRRRSKITQAPPTRSPHVLRAQQMNRDFEVFAVLPASAAANPSRR